MSENAWAGSPPSLYSFESDLSDSLSTSHFRDGTPGRMTPFSAPEDAQVHAARDDDRSQADGSVHGNENGSVQGRVQDHAWRHGLALTAMANGNDQQQKRQDEHGAKEHSKGDLVTGQHAARYVSFPCHWNIHEVLMARSSIRWAPMRLPLQRRLQTLVVVVHTISISLLLSIFFLLCAIPIVWPLLLPYVVYVLLSRAPVSGELSHRSKFLRSLPIWSLLVSYFPARLHRSEPLPATRKYIFGYHPHGIISHGAFVAFATEALGFAQLFPGITNSLLTLDSNFRLPINRDYLLGLGIASVSRESCEKILTRGGPDGEGMSRAITIVVGGARESLDAKPYTLRLILKRRKGFVKLAIRTGADLVPVLSFGENDLYEQVSSTSHPLIHKTQMLVKKLLGFTIPLFHARGVFNYDVGLLPYRRPLNIVVGRPIKVARQARPEDAYVDQIHADYVRELQRLWDEFKDEFAKDRVEEMQIVE